MTILTAEEARNLIATDANQKLTKQLELFDSYLKSAIKKGERTVKMWDLSAPAVAKIKELGYTVKDEHYYDQRDGATDVYTITF